MTQDVEKLCIANAVIAPEEHEEIEVSPQMIEAGEGIILSQIGGADLGGHFSAREMAKQVYLAMSRQSAIDSPPQTEERSSGFRDRIHIETIRFEPPYPTIRLDDVRSWLPQAAGRPSR